MPPSSTRHPDRATAPVPAGLPGGEAPAGGEALGDRRLILGIGALAATLVLILLTLFALRDREIERQRAEEIARNTTLVLAEHAGRLVETSRFLLTLGAAVAGGPGAPIPTDEAAHRELARLAGAASHIEALFVADEQGVIRLTSREWPVRPLPLSDREYFQRLRDGAAGPIFDRLETNPFTGRPQIILAQRLDPAAAPFRGVIGMAVSVAYFHEFYQRVAADNDLTVSLLRSDGLLLFRYPQPPEGVPRHVPALAGTDPAGGPASGWGPSPIDGRQRLFSSRPLPGEDLRVVVGMDSETIRQRWLLQVRTYGVYGAVALACIALLTALAFARARREALAWDRLRDANRLLEQRVADRTAALTVANVELGGALKDKEVLFREVHHRVKNNLQVICSLLRLQADRAPADARQGYEESLARIQSMSLVHEMLYRTNQPSSIDFAGYARELAANLSDAFAGEPDRIAMAVRAVPLVVDLDTAIPLGLLVTELVGNAMKHAFPDGAAGKVTVTLEHRDGTATLTVADDGVGLPPQVPHAAGGRPSGGLGMMLVRSLAGQIGGTVAIGARADGAAGTEAVVRFPWPPLP